jgi:hypothetical protein
MARQQAVPAVAPTVQPERAIPILENLISQADSLVTEQSDSTKRQQWAHTGEGALLASLGNKHPNIQAFGAAQCGVYHPDDTESDLRQQANDQLERMVAVLKSTVDQLRWQLPDPTQVFLPAGSAHDAYVEIRRIIQSATSEILIVDAYVDGTLWTLLTNLPASAKIRIMTMQMKGDFALEAKKFAVQHGNTIEVRHTQQYHDRFVVTDGDRCWHLGASIKDAGNKAFAMSEVLSTTIKSAIRTDVDATWNAARPVPL